MAVLRIQWPLPAQLIPDLPTVTARLIAHMEVGIVVVHLVRRAVLPPVELALHAAVVAVVAVGPVSGAVFNHCSTLGVELEL